MKANSPAWQIGKHLLIAIAVTLGMLAPRLPLDAIGIPHLVLLVQGLPTTVLIVLVAVEPVVELSRYRWGIVAALVFSQIGGYLLGRGLFVSGVLGFLVANIAYLTALTTGVRFGQRLAPFAVLGLCGGTILALAWSKIPSSHIIPVCLYAMAIVSGARPGNCPGARRALRRCGDGGRWHNVAVDLRFGHRHRTLLRRFLVGRHLHHDHLFRRPVAHRNLGGTSWQSGYGSCRLCFGITKYVAGQGVMLKHNLRTTRDLNSDRSGRCLQRFELEDVLPVYIGGDYHVRFGLPVVVERLAVAG